MKPNINPSLWERIETFSIDDPTAGIKFSDKLAFQAHWTPAFTAKAIGEYKKFIYLCCVSSAGASPSNTVDEVWHLHLTYTHNYWKEFCGKTLQREVHHNPSKGGEAEKNKHQNWYAETLVLYTEVFGNEPPTDIWPPASENTVEARSYEMPEANYAMIYKRNAYVLAVPFLFPFFCARLHPFALTGPQFLGFFGLLLVTTVAYLLLIRKQKLSAIQSAVNDADITSANAFQTARYVFGKGKVIEAAVVNLVAEGILTAERREQFLFYPARMDATTLAENPLAANLLRHHSGSRPLLMKDLADYYNEDLTQHAGLAAVYKTVVEKDLRGYFIGAAVLVLGLLRIVQGIENGYPVTYVQLMTMAGFVILLGVALSLSSKKIVQEVFTGRYQREAFMYSGGDGLLQKFVFMGVASIAGMYAFANLETTFRSHSGSYSGGGSSGCGSSCGSSCGSGCGGGCGGCGGGD